MSLSIKVERKDFPSYRKYLSEQEYRLVKSRIVEMVRPHLKQGATLLDVGCWDGESSLYYANNLGIAQINGIDCFDSVAQKAAEKGIGVRTCNLECDSIPFRGEQFDLVIANQVFEHLKNIYHLMDEVERVLKPGGVFVFSVPNLASLHCRLQLLFGVQPSIIKLFEAHVRVFTPNALDRFLAHGAHFKVLDFSGSGFYPFPPLLSKAVSKAFPRAALFLIYILAKKPSDHSGWKAEIASRGLQSAF